MGSVNDEIPPLNEVRKAPWGYFPLVLDYRQSLRFSLPNADREVYFTTKKPATEIP